MSRQLKFEDALRRLEEIVDAMDAGDIDLDKALSLFEEGVKLTRLCSARLDDAKKKVEILIKKGDGLAPEAFEPNTPITEDTPT
jgi:exodeoxyribonuclease VII small subunit